MNLQDEDRNSWVPFNVTILKNTMKAFLLRPYQESLTPTPSEKAQEENLGQKAGKGLGLVPLEEEEWITEVLPQGKSFWVPKSLIHSITSPEMIRWAQDLTLPLTLFLPEWFCKKEGHPRGSVISNGLVIGAYNRSIYNSLIRQAIDAYPFGPVPAQLTREELEEERVVQREKLTFLENSKGLYPLKVLVEILPLLNRETVKNFAPEDLRAALETIRKKGIPSSKEKELLDFFAPLLGNTGGGLEETEKPTSTLTRIMLNDSLTRDMPQDNSLSGLPNPSRFSEYWDWDVEETPPEEPKDELGENPSFREKSSPRELARTLQKRFTFALPESSTRPDSYPPVRTTQDARGDLLSTLYEEELRRLKETLKWADTTALRTLAMKNVQKELARREDQERWDASVAAVIEGIREKEKLLPLPGGEPRRKKEARAAYEKELASLINDWNSADSPSTRLRALEKVQDQQKSLQEEQERGKTSLAEDAQQSWQRMQLKEEQERLAFMKSEWASVGATTQGEYDLLTTKQARGDYLKTRWDTMVERVERKFDKGQRQEETPPPPSPINALPFGKTRRAITITKRSQEEE